MSEPEALAVSASRNRPGILELGRIAWVDKRLLSIAEMGLVAAYFFLTLWLVGPRIEQPRMAGLTLLSFVTVFAYCAFLAPTYIHEDALKVRGLGSPRTLFIRTDNLLDSGRDFGLITVAATAIMFLTAYVHDPQLLSHLNWKAFSLRLCYYFLSAYVQAMIFFQYFLVRLKRLLPPREGTLGEKKKQASAAPSRSRGEGWGAGGVFGNRMLVAFLCGLIFSAFHFPNFPLMILTLTAGAIWSWVFYAKPNVFALAVSQAWLGSVLHKVVGLSLRVGPFYEHSEKYFLTHVVPALSSLNGIIYGP